MAVVPGYDTALPASTAAVDKTAFRAWMAAVENAIAAGGGGGLTESGGSKWLAISKAATADTASTRYYRSGVLIAEVGLTGDDNLHVKVSPDGATWREALTVDAATGNVSIGRSLSTVSASRLVVENTGVFCATLVNTTGASSTSGAGIIAACLGAPLAAGDRLGFTLFSSLDPTVGGNMGGLACYAEEPFTATGRGTRIEFQVTSPGTAARATRLALNGDGTVRPGVDNSQTLGSASYRWSSIHAANGTIQTSDARDKDIVSRIPGATATQAVDAIEPVLFRWYVGSYDLVPSATEMETDDEGRVVPTLVRVARPGTRLHAGFIAQEVKAALDAVGADFGVWGLDDVSDPDSRQWIRPDQIIPVLWAALRETRAELAALRDRVAAVEGGAP